MHGSTQVGHGYFRFALLFNFVVFVLFCFVRVLFVWGFGFYLF